MILTHRRGFQTLMCVSESSEDFVKMQVSDSIGLGAKGRFVISNEIPDDAGAVRPDHVIFTTPSVV